MFRKQFFPAILMAVCLIASCESGTNGGNGGDNDSSITITAFGFTSAQNPGLSMDIPGTVSGSSIAVTVPHGTAVTALVADFTMTGVSVTVDDVAQESGVTANDFTDSATYTVTGADGSTQDYTVTVTVASASAKEITAFSFPAVTWIVNLYNINHQNGNDLGTTISGTSITAKLPYGSTSLVATFATSGASVAVGGVPQVSGSTSNDFTNPVTYRVTAADGSTQDYTVTVLFVPAVGCNFVTGKSSYWLESISSSTEVTGVSLGLTCDAVNAGSDIFTMQIITTDGNYYPYAPESGSGPYLTVPSDTTVTYISSDKIIRIVGPLTSIQSVIAQLEYVPPAYAVEDEMSITLTDKNGLKAYVRLKISVNEP